MAFSSRSFYDWLEAQQCSLAFTTYQSGKLFLVGRKADRFATSPFSIYNRNFPHCMGMCGSADARTLWVSSRYQIWRLERTPAVAVPYRAAGSTGGLETPQWVGQGYDYTYVPRIGYTTGHVDVHDMGIDADGRLVFVNTMFGCLATLSERANFKPIWRPPFSSALVPEDRCHLNGLAMRGGRPAFVTVVSRSDVADGWRDKRRDGGCVLDVATGEAVCTGLSMPHAPRFYRERLWLLNSGTGEFGTVDLASGRFEPIAFCPGYLRGLSFCGDYAVVTLSRPRELSFQGLALDERLEQKGASAQCGLQIIDLRTGTIAEWLRLEAESVTELYDSVVLPGVRQPMAVGFTTPEIERLMVIDDET
ncbi:MAG: TIGR03032 family protein [Planctomycetota bacterium]|nr:MAG: TIGR03032 family protein [Planctomycetota bacterium]